ncbi:hypothetical protein HWV62_24388 [Athelia sp. TMB]|nr:hypothetical protein HWV62_24388 [Athelia sp. TMB]
MAGTVPLLILWLAQMCGALPVSNHVNIAPSALNSTISLRLAASANLDQNDACSDFDHCRSLASIVTSCLGTIFACVWVAVHKNIPGPKQSWISVQVESLKVVLMTLLVPEWVLAWAVRQFLRAQQIATELEKVRLDPIKGGGGGDNGSVGDDERGGGNERDDHHETRLLDRHPNSESVAEQPPFAVELWDLEKKLGRTDQSWTIVHGFFIIMGGFHYYRDGEPMWPIPFTADRTGTEYRHKDVLTLVKSRSLVPPTVEELGDRSKGDTLSKAVAVCQTLWFVTQCIARRAQGMVVTNLEIMTLAYTVITVAMYAAWWHKPLNVRCPVRIVGNLPREEQKYQFAWTDTIDYVIGERDYWITLHTQDRVPTFWSDCFSNNGNIPFHADVIALSVAMVFGAIHCAAWSYTFPSLAEKTSWRASALAISVIPIPMVAALALFDPFSATVGTNFFDRIVIFCMGLCGLLYIIARIILLTISFTTLRHLPLSAFQTVQWTTFVPHI